MFTEVLNKLNAFITDVEALKQQIKDKDTEIAQLKQQLADKDVIIADLQKQIDNNNAKELRQLDEAIARLEAALRV